MKGLWLVIGLAVGLLSLAQVSRAKADHGCSCPTCYQSYATHHPSYRGHIQVYPSVDRRFFRQAAYPANYTVYGGHCAPRGEYWERQYGPFGARGFDW